MREGKRVMMDRDAGSRNDQHEDPDAGAVPPDAPVETPEADPAAPAAPDSEERSADRS
jgi:hypothetical protein